MPINMGKVTKRWLVLGVAGVTLAAFCATAGTVISNRLVGQVVTQASLPSTEHLLGLHEFTEYWLEDKTSIVEPRAFDKHSGRTRKYATVQVFPGEHRLVNGVPVARRVWAQMNAQEWRVEEGLARAIAVEDIERRRHAVRAIMQQRPELKEFPVEWYADSTRYREISLPQGWLALALREIGKYGLIPAGVAIGLGVSRARADRRRARVGTCKRCGYDLKGLPTSALCPECGKASL